MSRLLEEDRAYFRDHTTDRLLEIAQEWIASARGMLNASAGVVDDHAWQEEASQMIGRAQRMIELVLERTRGAGRLTDNPSMTYRP